MCVYLDPMKCRIHTLHPKLTTATHMLLVGHLSFQQLALPLLQPQEGSHHPGDCGSSHASVPQEALSDVSVVLTAQQGGSKINSLPIVLKLLASLHLLLN